MIESVFSQGIFPQKEESTPQKWLRWFVWKIAIATFLLMAVGSATRVMNAGLACPDWPLCYGQLVPSAQMNLQVFLEWFHRLDAALIGFSTIALVALSWWYRQELPKWLCFASLFALFLIVFQGILGGLTVTQLLRFDIVTAHLGTAFLFLSTLIIIGSALTPYQGTTTVGKLHWLSLTSVFLIYIQCMLGGLVGSQWALHQCFDYNQLCTVMNSHIIGVVPSTLLILILIMVAWRTPAVHPLIRKLVNIAGILVITQILLGIATFKLHLQVEPLTVIHHSVGVALFATLVTLSVFSWRDQHQDQLTVTSDQ